MAKVAKNLAQILNDELKKFRIDLPLRRANR